MDRSSHRTYRTYPLSRILTVREIVSADYVLETLEYSLLHAHEDAWELCCALAGTLELQKGPVVLTLQPGELTLIPPGILHDSRMKEPGSSSLFISFSCSDACLEALREGSYPITGELADLLSRLIEELTGAFQLNDGALRIYRFHPREDSPLGAEQLICCYLEQVLIKVMRTLTRKNGRFLAEERLDAAMEQYLMERIRAYVRSHLRESITVSDVARQFHYSRSRLDAIVRSQTGEGVHALISNSQLHLAKTLLLEGNLSVQQVAEAAGYASPQYFSRRFRQETGFPPSRYAAQSGFRRADGA